VGDPEVDKTFKIPLTDGPQAFVEFDIRQGLYRMVLEAPTLRCSASKFIAILPDRNRKVQIAMNDGPVRPERPQLVMDGIAPQSFLYTKPTYVLLDKSIGCNQPVGKPTIPDIQFEYDEGAYYLWLYGDPALAGTDPVLAMKLRTPTGLAHYIRVPVPYSDIQAGSWASNIRFEVTEDEIDDLATEKTDTLLCLKLFETRVR
jgi:hypothetical protein